MRGPEQIERLSIRNDYPWDSFSESLFAQIGTMHLVAPYLPREIRTNFFIDRSIRELITKMYASENKEVQGFVFKPLFDIPKIGKTSPQKVAIAYSAGKDSMWNLWWASEKYGMDNVLVVHIRGLNKNSGPNEVKNVLNQQKKFGFKHLEVIELLNGSLNTGYQIMRSREMFLAGLIIPVAMRFGASTIIREGFFDIDSGYFTGLESNMLYFNRILKKLGIPVQVDWRNRDEMLTIKDLYDNKPEWMPYVCNCFTIACYQGSHRRNFQKAMPTLPLYDSQCGVCVKCRITNVARVLYDPAVRTTDPEDIRTFLEKTDNWIRNQQKANKGKMSNVLDMIEGPFMRDYAEACRQYDVKAYSITKNAQ